MNQVRTQILYLKEAPVLAGIAKNSHGCSPLLSLELLHVDHWERIHFSLLIVFLLKPVYVCCLAMETRADEGGIYSTWESKRSPTKLKEPKLGKVLICIYEEQIKLMGAAKESTQKFQIWGRLHIF